METVLKCSVGYSLQDFQWLYISTWISYSWAHSQS